MEYVEVKKRRKWPWILLIILVILLVIGFYFYFQIFPPVNVGPGTDLYTLNVTKIDKSIMMKFLYELGVGSLHKNVLTREDPNFCLIVDNSSYVAVIDKSIQVEEVSCSNPDLTIVTSSSELISAIETKNVKTAMKQSIIDGKTQMIVGSSEADLAAKGYLSLYNALK